jgi:hypothetical protein
MSHEIVVLDDVSRVTNHELITGLRRLVRADEALTAQLLVHLGEMDARGLYREYACTSMFAYCVERLCMSEDQTYLRIQAAWLGRQFPLILQRLAQGALHLTAIKLLARHLTPDNHEQLLEQARGKSKREVELLVAEIAPKPDVASRMRKLPERNSPQAQRPTAQIAPSCVETKQLPVALEFSSPVDAMPTPPADAKHTLSVDAMPTPPADAKHTLSVDAMPTPPADAKHTLSVDAMPTPSADAKHTLSVDAMPTPSADGTQALSVDAMPTPSADGTQALSAATKQTLSPPSGVGDPSRVQFALEAPRLRGSCKPLSPGRYKVEFTAGQVLHDKLKQLQDLLRHQVPAGDLATLVERAVDLLIDHSMKQRFAQTRTVKSRTAKSHTAKSHTAKSHTAERHAAKPHTAKPHTAKPHAPKLHIAEPHTAKPHTAKSSMPAVASASTSAAARSSASAATGASFGISGRGATTSTAESWRVASARGRSSRYIPRAVVREVYQRDAGQCTFVSAEGKRCSARGFLELHHHDPYARGGEATVENLRLVCRSHNALFAEREFGRSFMRSKRKQTREPIKELGPERVD